MKLRPASAPQGRKSDRPNDAFMGCFTVSTRRRASMVRQAFRRPTERNMR